MRGSRHGGDVQVANGKRYHKVVKDLVVSLAYQVRTEDGVLVDEFPVSAPLDYLHGHGSLIAGLKKSARRPRSRRSLQR